jgi:surfeit locus 1 family protein
MASKWLQPRRWVPALAAIVVIATTVSLGNWQMRRAAEKLELQGRIDAALAAPAVAIGADRRLGAEQVGRRVVLSGQWLDQFSVYVDNRTWRGRAGFHVLTPIRIEGSNQVALVLRGWIPGDPSNRSNLPALPVFHSAVLIEARVEPDLSQTIELARTEPPGPNNRLWQNASLERVAAWSGLELAPVLLRQTGEDPSGTLVRDWPNPGSGTEKHRAYAVQWYALALLTAALWLGLSYRSYRNRKA